MSWQQEKNIALEKEKDLYKYKLRQALKKG